MNQSARLACFALLALASRAAALVIQLDYSYDIADGGNFFGTHAAAKAALEQAAADLSAAIGPSLSAVTTDVFTGSQGGANASIDWDLAITNPVTTSTEFQPTFTFAADTVTIFVGMRPLSGGFLGEGGPIGVDLGFSSSGTLVKRVAAFHAAEANSNAVMPRGGGPAIGTIMGTFNTGGGSADYTLTYGTLAGSLSFDNDIDNSGDIDSDSMLDAFWHFELSTPVEAGQFDFYSVALHEMMHAIGFGVSDTWEANRSGTDWFGANAITLNGGSGSNLVTTDGHIRAGLMSPRFSDGILQEVVMDPAIVRGIRKSLTEMDLAFMHDLGYATAPEPSTAALLTVALLLISRRTSRQPAPCGGKSCRHS